MLVTDGANTFSSSTPHILTFSAVEQQVWLTDWIHLHLLSWGHQLCRSAYAWHMLRRIRQVVEPNQTAALTRVTRYLALSLPPQLSLSFRAPWQTFLHPPDIPLRIHVHGGLSDGSQALFWLFGTQCTTLLFSMIFSPGRLCMCLCFCVCVCVCVWELWLMKESVTAWQTSPPDTPSRSHTCEQISIAHKLPHAEAWSDRCFAIYYLHLEIPLPP